MEQWTVGKLRAELVGIPDDIPVSVLVATTPDGDDLRMYLLTGAGYGQGLDPDDDLFAGTDFPLLASLPGRESR